MPSPNSNNILALDIGATNTRIALISPDLTVLDMKKIPTPKDNLKAGIHDLISDFRGNHGDLATLAISVAGPVNADSVSLTNVAEHEKLLIFDFKDFAKKIYMINDASAAAVYQARLNHTNDLIFITISSGIGVGVVKDGHLVHFLSTTEELGHMPIESKYDLPCGCGGKNHWESYASGIDMPNFYNAWRVDQGLAPSQLSVQDIYTAAESDDNDARRFVIDVLGPINRVAIENILAIYKPEVIIIGGPVVLQNIDLFLLGIGEEILTKSRFLFPAHDEEICLLGAAAYALDNR